MKAIESPLKLIGAPMSPYSQKMKSYLRYKNIPFVWNVPKLRDGNKILGMTPPKVPIIPILYFPHENYEIGHVDSTPLIRRIESYEIGHSVIPSSSGISFLNDFIEDFADEWLTKAMMHYRWTYSDDIQRASTLIAFGPDSMQSKEENFLLAKQFADRQIGRLSSVIGLNSNQSPFVEKSFIHVVQLFDQILMERRFLFGNRPTSGDFGVFGQFSQLVLFDPTSSKLVVTNYPRVTSWSENFKDLSWLGVDDSIASQWPDQLSELSHSQIQFIRYIGSIYIPFLKANYLALSQSRPSFSCQLAGGEVEWTQNVFLYQGKCWKALRETYSKLLPEEKAYITEVLKLNMEE